MELLAGKDVLVGVIDVACERVESVEEVADTIAVARRYVDREHLIACTNCGMAPMTWKAATAKLDALVQGAAMAE